MENRDSKYLSRRTFLWKYMAAPAALLLAACGTQAVEGIVSGMSTMQANGTLPAPSNTVLLPTPACGDDDDDDLTLAQTEGPYYTPNTPEHTSFLEAGVTGTKMIVTGYVLSTNCQPVARALLDFWHADDSGAYDNVGYKLRGHFFTDDAGRYTLETIVPGLYPGRTRHFHVKVQAPNNPVLTTQLYFPGEPSNASDRIYNAALEMNVQDVIDGKLGTFNFVLDVA